MEEKRRNINRAGKCITRNSCTVPEIASRRTLLADKVTAGTHGVKWKCHTKVKHGFKAAALSLCSTCEVSAHLPCPTFMMTFMARLLHTPPSRFSRPSTVPLEVAAGRGEHRGSRRMEGEGKKEGRRKRRDGDTLVNEHVHNTQN